MSPESDTIPWLALADGSPDAILIATRQGDILHLNTAAAQLFSPEEPRPRWSQLIHPGDFPAFRRWMLDPSDALFRTRLAGQVTQWEWSLGTTPEAALLWLTGRQAVVEPRAIPRAPTTMTSWIPRPRPGQDQVRRLCGHLAHLLNNMLMSTLGNLELTLMDTDTSDPHHEMLLDARVSSGRAARLTQRLLDASTLGSFDLKPVLLSEWTQRYLNTLDETIEVQTRWSTDAPVHVDVSQLGRALDELLDNVIQARATTLHVDTFLGDSEVVLRLRNDGRAVPPRILACFGVPFPPAPTSGDGLGLAVVDGVMRGHGGSLHVSHIPGEGACVELKFPRATKSARAAGARTS